MKNSCKNIIFTISIIGNIVAFIIIGRGIIEETTVTKNSALLNVCLDSNSEQYEEIKREKTLTDKECVDALLYVEIKIDFLSGYIAFEDYDSYIQNSPETVNKLNSIISSIKDEKAINDLDSVKRIIEGRPKAKDLDKCTGIIRKYYHILKEKLKMKERNDFYN